MVDGKTTHGLKTDGDGMYGKCDKSQPAPTLDYTPCIRYIKNTSSIKTGF